MRVRLLPLNSPDPQAGWGRSTGAFQESLKQIAPSWPASRFQTAVYPADRIVAHPLPCRVTGVRGYSGRYIPQGADPVGRAEVRCFDPVQGISRWRAANRLTGKFPQRLSPEKGQGVPDGNTWACGKDCAVPLHAVERGCLKARVLAVLSRKSPGCVPNHAGRLHFWARPSTQSAKAGWRDVATEMETSFVFMPKCPIR